MRKTLTFAITALMLMCICGVGFYFIGDDNDDDVVEPTSIPVRTVTTDRGDFVIPGTAFMDGRDPEANLTVMTMSVFEELEISRLVCVLEHGTEVSVLDSKDESDSGGKMNFKIDNNEGCKGWVSWRHLGPEQVEPIGDEIWLGE